MNFSESVLERNGCSIHYWTGGKADTTLVVFTHGATVDHHEWEATLPVVAEHYRVLAWDVRSHGLSRPGTFDFIEARRLAGPARHRGRAKSDSGRAFDGGKPGS